MSRFLRVASLIGFGLAMGVGGCSLDKSGDTISWDDLLMPGEQMLSSNESAILRERFPPLNYNPEHSFSYHSYIIIDSSLHHLEGYFGDTIMSSEWAQAWHSDSVEINALLQNLIEINKEKFGWAPYNFDLDNDYYYIPGEYVERDWDDDSERKSAMKDLYPHQGVKLSKIAFNQDSTLAMLCIYRYPFLSNEQARDLEWMLFLKSNDGWEQGALLYLQLRPSI